MTPVTVTASPNVIAEAVKAIMRASVDEALVEAERLAKARLLEATARWAAAVGQHARMEFDGSDIVLRIRLGNEVFQSGDREAVMRAIFGEAAR